MTATRVPLLRTKYSFPDSKLFPGTQPFGNLRTSEVSTLSSIVLSTGVEAKLLLQLSNQLDVLLLGILGSGLVLLGNVLPCVVLRFALDTL